MKIIVNNAGDVKTTVVASGAQGPQGPIGALNADDRAYVDSAKASASASEISAGASATIATTAQGSATASAAAALVSETNAATSEVSSSASASTATAAATNLVTALAAFREVFLGSFSADPAVDGNGNPLKSGAEYYNTTTDKIRVYSGGAWQDNDAEEQQETTNAALSAAAAAAASSAAATSETNAADSAATASAGAATVAAAVTASAASATAAAESASSADGDKTAAATSAAAAAQSAIDASNNAGAALPLAGGVLTGPVSSKYASPTYTMTDTSQAGGAGAFRWTSVGGAFKLLRNTAAGGDFSNSTTPLAFAANDVGTFSQRPMFGINAPWDGGNLVAPLVAADNLNGVADKPTARKNLGVGRTLLHTETVSTARQTIDIPNVFTSEFTRYEILFDEMQFNVTASLVVRLSNDGSTFDNSAAYRFIFGNDNLQTSGVSSHSNVGANPSGNIQLIASIPPASGSVSTAAGRIDLVGTRNAGQKLAIFEAATSDNAGSLVSTRGMGQYLGASPSSPLTGIQFLSTAGTNNFLAGSVSIYGVNK